MPESTRRKRDKAWMPVVMACSVLIGVSMWASVLLPVGKERTAGGEPTGVTESSESFPQQLRVWQGRLARFCGDSDRPTEVYEVWVASLPAEEQQRLETGIAVQSEDELAALLENYTS